MKIPEGSSPCPRAGAEAGVRREAPNGGRSGGPRARRAARGVFQNPRTGDGDLAKNADQKPEFCTYFFSHSYPTLIKQYEYCCYHSYFVPLKNILHQHKSLRASKEENDTLSSIIFE